MDKFSELIKLDLKILKDKMAVLRKESLNLRFQKSSGQLEKTARISVVKKQIARIKTAINLNKKTKGEKKNMPKRVLKGVVVSDKAEKTITVKVSRKVMHPVYKKYINRSKKYSVHDEENKFKIGQLVSIQENKPISKTKKWIVIS